MSRTIVHLSDLHFGRIDDGLLDPLIQIIQKISPDITAVSGDFTQHAFPSEFEQAARFLARIGGRQIVVPGNHDMAFLNPLRRVTQRLRLYKRYITADLYPFYQDEEVAVLGLNTARVSHLRDGRIRSRQIGLLEERMNSVPAEVIRVLVTHHPFDLPASFHAREIVGRGSRSMARVTKCVDLMLAGHMHISHSGPTVERYKMAGQSAVFVQAGTAISVRSRGEPNAFQVIVTARDRIEIRTCAWSNEQNSFIIGAATQFKRSADGWAR